MGYRCPDRVAHVVVPPSAEVGEAAVYLIKLPDGDPMGARGSAALIWVLAAEGETDVAQALADLLGRSREDVARHVDAYLRQLVDEGWLAESP